MYYLYYCNSSYQLINVLNLHWQRRFSNFENIDNYYADLIMLDAYDGAKEIYEILEQTKIFNNIKLVNRVKIKGMFHSLRVIRDIVFPNNFLKREYKFANVDSKYDYICTPKFNRLVAAIWQVNRKAKLQMHEDGLGTYICDLGSNILPKTYRLIYKTFNYGRSFNDIDSIYINKKSLYSYSKPEILKEIPKMNENYKLRLLEIFRDFSISEDNSKMVYWFSQIMFKSKSKDAIEKMLDILFKNEKMIVYCPHPRNPIKAKRDFDKSIGKQIWELKILNTENINSKCLIASHSTACLTPFILYDMQPYIILTYNMIDEADIANKKAFDLFVLKMKEMYKDKEKIMIPKTIEEFELCVNKFIKSSKNGK